MGLARRSPYETIRSYVIPNDHSNTYRRSWGVVEECEVDETVCDQGADMLRVVEWMRPGSLL